MPGKNKVVQEPQIITEELGDNMLKISAPEGWKLYNTIVRQCFANGSVIYSKDLPKWELVEE